MSPVSSPQRIAHQKSDIFEFGVFSGVPLESASNTSENESSANAAAARRAISFFVRETVTSKFPFRLTFSALARIRNSPCVFGCLMRGHTGTAIWLRRLGIGSVGVNHGVIQFVGDAYEATSPTPDHLNHSSSVSMMQENTLHSCGTRRVYRPWPGSPNDGGWSGQHRREVMQLLSSGPSPFFSVDGWYV